MGTVLILSYCKPAKKVNKCINIVHYLHYLGSYSISPIPVYTYNGELLKMHNEYVSVTLVDCSTSYSICICSSCAWQKDCGGYMSGKANSYQ